MSTESRQAGTVEGYEGRGVWVPDGLTADAIMRGAAVLERELDVPPYSARVLASMILEEAHPRFGHDGKNL